MHFGNYKLGRIAPKPEHGAKRVPLAKHLVALPPAPREWDGATPVVNGPIGFKMLGNDRRGNCVDVAFANRIILEAKEDGVDQDIEEEVVVSLYDQQTDGRDTGLVPHDAFEEFLTYGFPLKNTVPVDGSYKVKVRAGIAPGDFATLRLAMANFSGALVGAGLPLAAQDGSKPWDVGDGAPFQFASWGGHEMLAAKYDDQFVYLVTWAHVQPATWEWLARYADDLEIVIGEKHLAKFPDGGEAILAEAEAIGALTGDVSEANG